MMNREELIKIKEKYEAHLKEVNKLLEDKPERKESFGSGSGEIINRLYTPCDISELNYLDEIGFPGQYPYTRGVQSTLYRGKLWTMRMYAGYATAEESNKRYKYLIEQGTMGLSVAFDLPTQIGYDSDHLLSEGEVGKVGVAIDSLQDMETLFKGISLDQVSTSMTINSTAPILLAMYIAAAEKQGIRPNQLKGTIQNDILKEYIARGTYIFPIRSSMRLITNIFEYCSKEMPRWNAISVSGYHIREAGSTAAQELGFTLANGVAYVEAAIKAGLDVDAFAPRLSFFFNAHNDLFEEVAKYRAARRLWAKIMKNRFNAKKEKSMQLKFHTQTAGCTLTAQQPENNVVRVTLQALAAVLGGTQSLHTNSKDEALALPNEDSVRVALRTQQIIAHESGAADTVDPLAGSYYIETKTNEIEAAAMKYIEKIDEMGGVQKAIENGYIQKEIMDSAYQYQKSIEEGQRIIVGMNQYQVEEESPHGLLKVNPAVEIQQKQKLLNLRKKRNSVLVEEKLRDLRKACQGDDNLVPPIIEAVRVYCTIGEICGVMRDVFGEYQQTINL